MCRLFAYAGPGMDLSSFLLAGDRTFRALGAFHDKGWGTAHWPGGTTPVVHKSGLRADEDAAFEDGARALTNTTVAMAHLRRSMEDPHPMRQDAHPWSFGPWAFCHNGGVRGLADTDVRRGVLDTLRPSLRKNVRGGTDSELVFHLILEELLAQYGTLAVPLRDAAGAMAAVQWDLIQRFPGPEEKPTTANFLLAGPDGIVASRWGPELVRLDLGDHHLLSSEPLGPADLAWAPVGEGDLVVLGRREGLVDDEAVALLRATLHGA